MVRRKVVASKRPAILVHSKVGKLTKNPEMATSTPISSSGSSTAVEYLQANLSKSSSRSRTSSGAQASPRTPAQARGSTGTPAQARGSPRTPAQARGSTGTPAQARGSTRTPARTSTGAISSGKSRRWRPKTRLLREIRALQKSTNVLIPKLSFLRVVKEILQALEMERRREGYALIPGAYLHNLRIQGAALACLQEACEMHLTHFFSDAYACTLHAKRVTLFVKDMQLARKIRGPLDPMNP